jgi:hypothetical protein
LTSDTCILERNNVSSDIKMANLGCEGLLWMLVRRRQNFSVPLVYCGGQFEDIAKFKKDICPPVLNN